MKKMNIFFFGVAVALVFAEPVSACEISGQWNLQQQGGYRGTLYLTQTGTALSGSMDWENHRDAVIEQGVYFDNRIEMVFRYSGGLTGTYQAIIDPSCQAMINGKAFSNQGDSVNWSATRKMPMTTTGMSVGDQQHDSVVSINTTPTDYLENQDCDNPVHWYFKNWKSEENRPGLLKNLVLTPGKYTLWVYGGNRAVVSLGAIIGKQKTRIIAGVDADKCVPTPTVFNVPPGMEATGFYVEQLDPGFNCYNKTHILEKGYHICKVDLPPPPGGGTDDTSPHTPSAPVHNALVNLALGKKAFQSSTGYGGNSNRAVDGKTDGNYMTTASVTHTNQELHAWWQVDLGKVETIDLIRIWNRTDCCAERLSDFYVLVSNQAFSSTNLQETLQQPGVWHVFFEGQPGTKTDIPVHAPGRYVRIQLSRSNYLSLAEVEVFRFSGSGQKPLPDHPCNPNAGPFDEDACITDIKSAPSGLPAPAITPITPSYPIQVQPRNDER